MAYISHSAGRIGGRRPLRAGLVLVVLALLGAALAGLGSARLARLPWDQMATSISVRFWPVAEARVLSAAITEVRTGAPGGGSEMLLSVSYEFDTPAGLVTASGAGLADRSAPEDRRLLALYRRAEFARMTGHPLPVYYSRSDPTRAYLDASLPWRTMLPDLFFGAVFLYFGAQFLARAAERGAGARFGR